jgi:hypothetical protein
MEIRTPDLLHAMQALYQLSYSPSRGGQRALSLAANATPVYKNSAALARAYLLNLRGHELDSAFRVIASDRLRACYLRSQDDCPHRALDRRCRGDKAVLA